MTDSRSPLDRLDAYADAEESLFTHEQGAPNAFAALRAVLALHTPSGHGDMAWCNGCEFPWPCLTLDAITEALNAP